MDYGGMKVFVPGREIECIQNHIMVNEEESEYKAHFDYVINRLHLGFNLWHFLVYVLPEIIFLLADNDMLEISKDHKV